MYDQSINYLWDNEQRTILRIVIPHKLVNMNQLHPIAENARPYITSQPHTVHVIWHLHQPPIIFSRDAQADYTHLHELQPENLGQTIFIGLLPHQKIIARMFNVQFSDNANRIIYVDSLDEARARLGVRQDGNHAPG